MSIAEKKVGFTIIISGFALLLLFIEDTFSGWDA
jgi:hypothetical protein